ncbi:MAG: glycosyltransferase family 4 protein [Roseiflexaceae bacterium]
MPRTLIVSTDVVSSQMAGPGIRAWELARALARDGQVTLAVPVSCDLAPDGFDLAIYPTDRRGGELATLINRADSVVVQGLVLERYPELLEHQKPLAIDLYDPMLLEGLDMVTGSGQAAAQAQFARYAALNDAQFERGDFFFCATERQRDYWLGALTATRRITPELISSSDRDLRDLIDLVPSGVPAGRPVASRPVMRGVHPAIGKHDIILLWAGGLWDWFEPDLLVRAMRELSTELPMLKLVFFGGARPTAEGQPFRTRAHARAYALAEQFELLNRNVIFVEAWVPYERRADFLAEADVGVSAHRPGVETRFAFRTRLLDYIWARLPMALSAGDSLSQQAERLGAALTVAPGDLGGWVQILGRLARDPILRATMRQAAEPLAAQYAWSEVARPLIRFCARPRRTAHTAESVYNRVAALEQQLRERDGYIQHVEASYQDAVSHAQRLERAIQTTPSARAMRLVRWVGRKIGTLSQKRRRP